MIEAVPESETHRLYSVLDLLPGYIILLAPDHTIRFANRTFRELFGDPEGLLCHSIIHRTGDRCDDCPAFRVFETKQEVQWEWTCNQNNKTFKVHDHYFINSDGTPMVIETGIDITDWKKAENELLEKEERFRTMVDFTYDWEYWVSKDGLMIYNSPACERITGRSAQEFINDPSMLVQITYPEDRIALEKHILEELSDKKRVFSLDFRILTPNKEEHWIGHICQPVFDSHGTYQGRRVSNREITERKQAEEALIHSERLAAIGRLVATLAHEIHNPLQALNNCIELVMDFPLDADERQSYLETIREEIERLSQISVGILDFARLREVRRVPTDIFTALRHALAIANQQLRQGNIHVRLELTESLPPIFASPDQIEQVFLNLIINATEQMPAGGELTISVRKSKKFLEVRFKDTGDGIPPERLQLIFEPFFTTKTEGTGLGLAISQKIIRQHKGELSAKNSPEGGAVFSVVLPLKKMKSVSVEERANVRKPG